ncbi:MAG: tRNA uridine-5-carboxymethylaminomethyl(34) synthesis GTPase MnmE [Flavobacteriaceae bacterium]|nr:tRNA uridine-5-carboxymethylaminomethyl(34) synthesis GTPase MnmE [Flavobacteriaceae bacterium]
MIPNDTIVALATPAGVGAIAVIRLSGNAAISLASQVFLSIHGKDLTKQSTHTILLGHIVKENNTLDEVLLSIFKNPHSYTGEDVVEFSCHGSNFIQQEIIQLLISKGARLAEAGEFTLRAFLNGKMDLSQAEAVADLIASNSEASHKVAMQQMRGGYSNQLQDLRQQLLDYVSLLELELDFAEEDVAFADRSKFRELVTEIQTVIQKLMDSFALGNALKNGIPVAILGKPNAGKSTLLNALLQEERAIVSDIAGTTRDAIEDEVILKGIAFRFIDTAGLRETIDSIEHIGIQKAYEKATAAQLILYLVDAEEAVKATKDIETQWLEIQNRFESQQVLMLLNKTDKISQEDLKSLQTAYPKALAIAAKTQTGIAQLETTLLSLVSTGQLSNNETIVSNSRHFEALKLAHKSILAVKEGIDEELSTDLLAIDLHECLRQLGVITGEFDVDQDILGNIFSNFCIGK